MKFQFTNGKFETQFGDERLTIARNNEEGIRPFQLLISSMAGCSGLVFNQIIEKQRIELDEFYISADYERNEAESNRVEKIILTFHVKGKDLNEEKLQRNLQLTRKNCAMIRSVDDSIEIIEQLNVLD